MQTTRDESEREQLLELVYPNGRIHRCSIRRERDLHLGAEVELLGRMWRVRGVRRPQRGSREQVPRLVCFAITGSPLDSRRRTPSG
jgi:hypothetical protein